MGTIGRVGVSQAMTVKGATSAGATVLVQLYNGSGASMVSGDDTYAVFSVAGFLNVQQFDTNGLFDGISTITIDTETAGYWEWDSVVRFGFGPDTTGYQMSIAIEINGGADDPVGQAYAQVDPSSGSFTGEMDLVLPVIGRNMLAGDTVKLLMVLFSTNSQYTKALIRGRRIGDALTVLPYSS